MLFEVALAQTDAFGGDLDQLIVLNELDRIFQGQLYRGRDFDGVFFARHAEVGQLLLAHGIDHQIVVTAVDAHDHALVHRVAMAHKHAATVVELAQSVGDDFAVIHADQHAVFAAGNFTSVSFVAIKDVAGQTGATGQVEKLVLKTNQTACRDAVFQAHTAPAIGLHVGQFGFALAKGLHHTALVAFFKVHGEHFNRFMAFTIDLFINHTGFGHGQFIALAAHVFQQNGQVQFATARHLVNPVFVGVLHAQGHVGLQLFVQTIAQLAAGHELAFTTCQRRVVDAKIHGQGGLVNFEHGQGCG